MFGYRRSRAVSALCAVTVGVLGIGMTASVAGAQSSSSEGVTSNSVKLGYIGSDTGVASPNFEDSSKACQARVDAQNAGAVNPSVKFSRQHFHQARGFTVDHGTIDLAERKSVGGIPLLAVFQFSFESTHVGQLGVSERTPRNVGGVYRHSEVEQCV